MVCWVLRVITVDEVRMPDTASATRRMMVDLGIHFGSERDVQGFAAKRHKLCTVKVIHWGRNVARKDPVIAIIARHFCQPVLVRQLRNAMRQKFIEILADRIMRVAV